MEKMHTFPGQNERTSNPPHYWKKVIFIIQGIIYPPSHEGQLKEHNPILRYVVGIRSKTKDYISITSL